MSRRVFAVGMSTRVARVCGWCPDRPFLTWLDRIRWMMGAPISHGMCARCEEQFANGRTRRRKASDDGPERSAVSEAAHDPS